MLNFSNQTKGLLLNVSGCGLVWFLLFWSFAVLQIQPKALHIRILQYSFFLRQSHLNLGWPRTYWPTCLCLLSTRVKGMFHHSPLQTSVVIFCVRLSLVEPSCPEASRLSFSSKRSWSGRRIRTVLSISKQVVRLLL